MWGVGNWGITFGVEQMFNKYSLKLQDLERVYVWVLVVVVCYQGVQGWFRLVEVRGQEGRFSVGVVGIL